MIIKILAFGIAKEIFGGSSIDFALENEVTTVDLKAALEERYPSLAELSSYLLAVNNEYAAPDLTIGAKDEVAIIPPVSGG